jgi:hypothetical protein
MLVPFFRFHPSQRASPRKGCTPPKTAWQSAGFKERQNLKRRDESISDFVR